MPDRGIERIRIVQLAATWLGNFRSWQVRRATIYFGHASATRSSPWANVSTGQLLTVAGPPVQPSPVCGPPAGSSHLSPALTSPRICFSPALHSRTDPKPRSSRLVVVLLPVRSPPTTTFLVMLVCSVRFVSASHLENVLQLVSHGCSLDLRRLHSFDFNGLLVCEHLLSELYFFSSFRSFDF